MTETQDVVPALSEGEPGKGHRDVKNPISWGGDDDPQPLVFPPRVYGGTVDPSETKKGIPGLPHGRMGELPQEYSTPIMAAFTPRAYGGTGQEDE